MSILLQILYTNSLSIFIVELFTIARKWNQPNICHLINKQWKCGTWYTMEFHSAVKENEIMKISSKWIELEKNYHLRLLRPRCKNIVCSFSHVNPNYYSLGLWIWLGVSVKVRKLERGHWRRRYKRDFMRGWMTVGSKCYGVRKRINEVRRCMGACYWESAEAVLGEGH